MYRLPLSFFIHTGGNLLHHHALCSAQFPAKSLALFFWRVAKTILWATLKTLAMQKLRKR